MKLVLKIFVAEHCFTCTETLAIATRVAQDFPNIRIEVIDMGDAQATVPESVFAVPTFMLNNQIVSLGNPKPAEIAGYIENAISHPT